MGISLKASEVIPAIGLQVDAPTAVAGLYPVGAADVGPSIDELGIYRGEVVLGDPILGCDAFVNATALADKIVLVRRGTCPYATKTQNAAAAGAVAVLVVDNALSDFPNASAGSYVLPIFHLRLIDGDALIAAAPLDVSMGPRLTADITWGPDVLAGIGSRGPTADQLLLKPDLAAPGWQIVSASAGTGIEGIALSGSSMSSPLVAGGAAILRQGRPELGPLDVKALLTSSARPMRGPLGNLFPATGVGAGRIAVDAALAATITARSEGDTGQAGVSFGVVVTSSLRTESRTVVVTSTESEIANLDVTLEAASSWPGLLVTVSPESIEVPPNGSATFELTLTVDPELLPRAPAYGQYMDTVTATPDEVESGRRDTPAIVFTATSGRVVLTPRAGSGEPVAVVAYYGAGRAAAERVVAGASGCVGAVGESATGGSASLTFSGAAAHHDNATSVLELGTITSTFSAPGGPDAFADIVATGALSDPDSERVFFAVATAGDWVTPAQEFLSVVGFEIDTDEDRIADFLVVAESFLQPDPEVPYADLQSAPFARVVDLASGESSRVVEPLNSVDPAYPGGQFFGRETHETQIYFNRVLVMPVSFDNLGLSASDARLAYRGVSIVSRLPFVVDLPADPPMDTTDWAELDAAAPTLSLPDCVAGTPLCADEPDSIALDLHADAVDAALPKLLVLHHANGEAPHHEVIDLADLATAGAFTSDLALTAAPGRAIDEGAEAASEFTVTASDARDDVRLTFTATGGSISALTTSVGTCTADTCELGALARDGSATITVTGLASGAGTLTMTGSVTSTPACESDPSNDRATATFTVSAVGPEVGPEPSPEAAEPSPEVAEPSPETAAEAAPSKGSDWDVVPRDRLGRGRARPALACSRGATNAGVYTTRRFDEWSRSLPTRSLQGAGYHSPVVPAGRLMTRSVTVIGAAPRFSQRSEIGPGRPGVCRMTPTACMPSWTTSGAPLSGCTWMFQASTSLASNATSIGSIGIAATRVDTGTSRFSSTSLPAAMVTERSPTIGAGSTIWRPLEPQAASTIARHKDFANIAPPTDRTATPRRGSKCATTSLRRSLVHDPSDQRSSRCLAAPSVCGGLP